MIDGIIKKLGNQMPIAIVDGTVISVNKSDDLCDVRPLNGDADLLDVKLAPVKNTDGKKSEFVVYPEVGSYVVVGFINNQDTNAMVISITDIESIKLNISSLFGLQVGSDGGIKLKFSSLQINGGGLGALPTIGALTDKLNALEGKLNDMFSKFDAHSHPSDGAVSATKAPGTIAKTKAQDLANNKITQ
jgi:hypothetical protein